MNAGTARAVYRATATEFQEFPFAVVQSFLHRELRCSLNSEPLYIAPGSKE
jgi:hypothetical protein